MSVIEEMREYGEILTAKVAAEVQQRFGIQMDFIAMAGHQSPGGFHATLISGKFAELQAHPDYDEDDFAKTLREKAEEWTEGKMTLSTEILPAAFKFTPAG